jgi:hypothetical protein
MGNVKMGNDKNVSKSFEFGKMLARLEVQVGIDTGEEIQVDLENPIPFYMKWEGYDYSDALLKRKLACLEGFRIPKDLIKEEMEKGFDFEFEAINFAIEIMKLRQDLKYTRNEFSAIIGINKEVLRGFEIHHRDIRETLVVKIRNIAETLKNNPRD